MKKLIENWDRYINEIETGDDEFSKEAGIDSDEEIKANQLKMGEKVDEIIPATVAQIQQVLSLIGQIEPQQRKIKSDQLKSQIIQMFDAMKVTE